jgi:hypothetical protein
VPFGRNRESRSREAAGAQELARSSAQEMWAEKGGRAEVSEIASAGSGGHQEAGTTGRKTVRLTHTLGSKKSA